MSGRNGAGIRRSITKVLGEGSENIRRGLRAVPDVDDRPLGHLKELDQLGSIQSGQGLRGDVAGLKLCPAAAHHLVHDLVINHVRGNLGGDHL